MKKHLGWWAVGSIFVLSIGFQGSAKEAASRDLNAWLAYTIEPRQLRTALRPSLWGNGRIELLAELNRPLVNEVVSFGFGDEGLRFGSVRGRGEQHLLPAIYDDDTGRKYLLHSTPSGAQSATVTFRPDRQIWRYQFDDLTVDVSLILPRLQPGYLFKLELFPHQGNNSNNWRVYHQLRGYQGNILFATEAEYSLERGEAWCTNISGYGEAIGSTADARTISLGLDYDYSNDILVQLTVKREGERVSPVYLARAFGSRAEEAREGLARLLSTPRELELQAQQWWDQYLDQVPHLEVPDESFAKTYLWSWPSFRMNRIDVPIGSVPAGMFYSNNVSLKTKPWVGAGDQVEAGVIQLLHDPQPARDLTLFHFRNTRKDGLLSPGYAGEAEFPGAYVSALGWFGAHLHKYMLTTGDLEILGERAWGMTLLERLESALEAQMPFRDEKTGLFWTDGEMKRFDGLYPGELGGLGPNMEAVTRYRGARGSFYNDSNASVWGTFLVLADIQDLAGNTEKSARYRRLADDLRAAVQKYMWDEELGFFIDRRPDGSPSDYMGIGGFITGLFANQVYRPGGLATREQAERLVAWANHPDFISDFGVLCLARSSPYFDPADYKGFNSSFDMHWANQVAAGFYAHGVYQEAHRQLFKLFRRLGENAGLGPRYRGEGYNGDTGEILPWRSGSYPATLSALTSVFEGVFGMLWTNQALAVHVNSPWPWAKLTNMKIRNSVLDLELTTKGDLIARINGKEVARNADRKLELPWEMFN